MTTLNQKQKAIAPFITLLEAKGVLHTERFVGMGFHDDKLYLLKLHCKPEEVTARNKDFYFTNRKGDGPTFNLENNQTLDQAAAAYRFYGKDGGHAFSDFMMVPQQEMERVMLIASLKSGLATVEAGQKPTEEGVLVDALNTLFAHPDATAMMQEVDPTITADNVDEARDLLEQALHTVGKPAPVNATPVDQAGVSEQPAAPVQPEPAVEAAFAQGTAAPVDTVESIVKHALLAEAGNHPTDRLFGAFGWGR